MNMLVEYAGTKFAPAADRQRVLLGIWGRLSTQEREMLIAKGYELLERALQRKKQS